MSKSILSELEYLGTDYKYRIVELVIEQDIQYYKDLLKERVGLDDMDVSKSELDHLIDAFEVERTDTTYKIAELLEAREKIVDEIEIDYQKLLDETGN